MKKPAQSSFQVSDTCPNSIHGFFAITGRRHPKSKNMAVMNLQLITSTKFARQLLAYLGGDGEAPTHPKYKPRSRKLQRQ